MEKTFLIKLMDLYRILEINNNATEDEIKKSYYKLARIYHPDKNKNIDHNKFHQINYAYNILINAETRKKYNNINNKNDFHSLLEKIYNNEDINIKEELSSFGISKKSINNLENFMNSINLFDIMKIVSNKIIPKYKNNNNDCSESEINIFDETMAEYYDHNNFPILYQKYNKNNINLELDIDMEKLLNNETRRIKLNRINKNNNKKIKTEIMFNLNKEYVVYKYGGDIDDNNGHLIIKLKLPEFFKWDDDQPHKRIIYTYNINLYQYIYGVKINLEFLNKNIKITNYIPYRDGNYLNTNYKIGDLDFIINFKILYNDTEDNKERLYYICI